MAEPNKVNLVEAFARFSDHWSPKIVGELNDSYVKLVKLQGEFVWHHHDTEDELFLVIRGRLQMRFRDRDVWLDPGEFIIVPRGVEHMPVAPEECEILLLEPKTTSTPATSRMSGRLRNWRDSNRHSVNDAGVTGMRVAASIESVQLAMNLYAGGAEIRRSRL